MFFTVHNLSCIILQRGKKPTGSCQNFITFNVRSWTFTFIFHQIIIIAIILFIESLQLFIRWHKYQHNTSNIYPETTH